MSSFSYPAAASSTASGKTAGPRAPTTLSAVGVAASPPPHPSLSVKAGNAGFLHPMQALSSKEAAAKATYQPSVLRPQRRIFTAAARREEEEQPLRGYRPNTADALPTTMTAAAAAGRVGSHDPFSSSRHRLPPLSATVPSISSTGGSTEEVKPIRRGDMGTNTVPHGAIVPAAVRGREAWPALATKDAKELGGPHGTEPSLLGYWSVTVVRRQRIGDVDQEDVLGTVKVPCPQNDDDSDDGVMAVRPSRLVVGVTAATSHLALCDSQQQQPQLLHEGKLSILAPSAATPTPIDEKTKSAKHPSGIPNAADCGGAWAVAAAPPTSRRAGPQAPVGPTYAQVLSTIEAEVDRLGFTLSHVMYLDEEFGNVFALLTPKTMPFTRHGVFRAIVTDKPRKAATAARAAALATVAITTPTPTTTIAATTAAKDALSARKQQRRNQEAAQMAALQADIDASFRQLEERFERSHAASDARDGGSTYETVMRLLHPTAPLTPSAPSARALVRDVSSQRGEVERKPDVFLSRLAEEQARRRQEVFHTRADVKWQASEAFRSHLQALRQCVSLEAVKRDGAREEERLARVFLHQLEQADREAVARGATRTSLASEGQLAEQAQHARVHTLIREVHAHTRALQLMQTRMEPEVRRVPEYTCDDGSRSSVFVDAELGVEESERALATALRYPVYAAELIEECHASVECGHPPNRERLLAEEEHFVLREVATVAPVPTPPPTPALYAQEEEEARQVTEGVVEERVAPAEAGNGEVQEVPEEEKTSASAKADDDVNHNRGHDSVDGGSLSYALTSLAITFHPAHWRLLSRDFGPMFAAVCEDVATCLGLSPHCVVIANDQREKGTALSSSSSLKDGAPATAPYAEVSGSGSACGEQTACVVHFLVEHDGERDDDELQSLIASYGFPCLTHLCEQYAEKTEEGSDTASGKAAQPDAAVPSAGEEEKGAEVVLTTEALPSAPVPRCPCDCNTTNSPPPSPHTLPLPAEPDVANTAAEIGLADDEAVELDEPQGPREQPLPTYEGTLLSAEEEEEAVPRKSSAAPAEEADEPPVPAPTCVRAVEAALDPTPSTSPVVVERVAIIEQAATEPEKPRVPEPEPEWYLEYLAMRQQTDDARQREASAPPSETHLDHLASDGEDSDEVDPTPAVSLSDATLVDSTTADEEAQLLRDLCGGERASVTEHTKTLAGEEWHLVLGTSRDYVKQRFTQDLATGLGCDPRCVRNVFIFLTHTGCELMFELVHREEVSKDILGRFIDTYPFPLLTELYERCPRHPYHHLEERQQEHIDEEFEELEEVEEEMGRQAPATTLALDERAVASRLPASRSGGSDTDVMATADGEVASSSPRAAASGAELTSFEELSEPSLDGESLHPVPREEGSAVRARGGTETLQQPFEELVSRVPFPSAGGSDEDEDPIATTTTVSPAEGTAALHVPDDADFEELWVEPTSEDGGVGDERVISRPAHPAPGAGVTDAAVALSDAECSERAATAAATHEPHTRQIVDDDPFSREPTIEERQSGGPPQQQQQQSVVAAAVEPPPCPATPEPEEYTKVCQFHDFSCSRLSLAPSVQLAEFCGLTGDALPALSHHHVWLRGDEWGVILDSCPLFLRDQFTSEMGELLHCPARCVRNVLLRASAESLRIDFDLIHDAAMSHDVIDSALRDHVFHLLMELYRSRHYVAMLMLDEGLEADLPLYAHEAVPGTEEEATARTPLCPRPPSRDGAPHRGQLSQPPRGGSADTSTGTKACCSPFSHEGSSHHLPRPSSTHTNYERLSLDSTPASPSIPPPTAPFLALAASPATTNTKEGESYQSPNRPTTTASACSGDVDCPEEVRHTPPLAPLVPRCMTAAAAVSRDPSLSSSAAGVPPQPQQQQHPDSAARRSFVARHAANMSDVPVCSKRPANADTEKRDARPGSRSASGSASPFHTAETCPLVGHATNDELGWVHHTRSAGVMEQSTGSTNLATGYSTSSLSTRLDPSTLSRPSNPIYQYLNSSYASSNRKQSIGTPSPTPSTSVNHQPPRQPSLAADGAVSSGGRSHSRCSSANVEEVPGYQPLQGTGSFPAPF